jgi:tetratricopeptide (TPR) repeat protein
MKLRIAYLVIAAVTGFVAGAANGQERYDLKVRNDFFAGFGGDAAALERAMKATAATLAENPDHAEALVWHGGGNYFLAGQAFQKGDPQKGMELAQKGIAEMDRAVELAPDDIGVRIPRGSVLMTATRFQQGPHVAPLVQRALSDFEKTYELQLGILDKLGTHPKGELLMALADGYNRTGNKEKAKLFYERIATEMTNTPYARSAKEWLETGTLEPRKAGCLGCHAGN